jgi:hypothetical protein
MSEVTYESGDRLEVKVSEENEKTGKRYYTNVGSAFINRDGSIGVRLRGGIAVMGELYITRPYEEQGGGERRREGGGNRGGGGRQQQRGKAPPRRVSQDDFDFPEGEGGAEDPGGFDE